MACLGCQNWNWNVPCLVVLLGFVSGFSLASEQDLTSDEVKAENYLKQYGYYSLMPEGRRARYPSVVDKRIQVSRAIKKFQGFAGLPITGKLDGATKSAFDRPRCGVPDLRIVPKDATAYRWRKTKLTWNLQSRPPQLSRGQTRKALQEAFDTWSNAIPLDFREISSSTKADFTMEFGRYDHGDPWPFDGPGRILAHAMFPEDGRAHFDSDESWAYRDEKLKEKWKYTDLLAVAIHELGHALGLSHSRNPDSIMAPFYKATDLSGGYEAPKLHPDDLYHIQNLYGSRISAGRTTKREPLTTTQRSIVTTTTEGIPITKQPRTPRPKPDKPGDEPTTGNCPVAISAATKTLSGKSYLFSGIHLWEFDQKRKRIGGMKQISEVFPQGPMTVTAAVTNPRTFFTLLFQNRRVWAYIWKESHTEFQLHPNFPKDLPTEIQFVPAGAFLWVDGNVVLTKGNDFVTYDSYWNVPTMVNFVDNYFPNLPKSVTGAVRTSLNSLLLFSSSQAYVYDMNRKETINENGVNFRTLFKC